MKGSLRCRTRWMLAAVCVWAVILAAPLSAAAQEGLDRRSGPGETVGRSDNWDVGAYIGEIRMFAGSFAPEGWAFCDGQFLAIGQNPELFSIIANRYGGDGRVYFALPDLRGRFAIHSGCQKEGRCSYSVGWYGGRDKVTLTDSELPSHIHAATARAVWVGDSDSPEAAIWAAAGDGGLDYSTAAPDTAMSPDAIEVHPAGGGAHHENMPPYLGVNFIIALEGIYPPRY